MSSINPYVARLFVYPIKSLDPEECDRGEILEAGAIKGDRTWAMFDLNNNFVNGKRHAKTHNLRSTFNFKTNSLTLQIEGKKHAITFNSIEQQDLLCDW
ncbi:MAG: MOSC N-terminal beta barrel domain-containing protein [Pleurocapsa sp.]